MSSKNVLSLFDEGEEDGGTPSQVSHPQEKEEPLKFGLNKEFAERFEAKARIRELEQLKAKLGPRAAKAMTAKRKRTEEKRRMSSSAKSDGSEDESVSSVSISSSSDESDEDDEAVLDTQDKDLKFLTMLPLISSTVAGKGGTAAVADNDGGQEDRKKRLIDQIPEFDDDDDDDGDDAAAQQRAPRQPQSGSDKQEKVMRLGDYVRDSLLRDGAKALLSDSENDDDDDAGGRSRADRPVRRQTVPYNDEQRELKQAFLTAFEQEAGSVGVADDNGNDDDDDDDDGLLRRKPKAAGVESLSTDDATSRLELAKQQLSTTAADNRDSVDQFWKASNISDEDKFLRTYVLNKGWLETGGRTASAGGDDGGGTDVAFGGPTSAALAPMFADIDSDDSEAVHDQEQFEAKYNFRFEEEGGDLIVGHTRGGGQLAAQSARLREVRPRARKREKRDQKKQHERDERARELRRLKKLHRQQLNEKVKQLADTMGLPNDVEDVADVAPVSAPAAVETLLKDPDLIDGDFDPDQYDQLAAKLFGPNFYNMPADTEKPVFSDDDGGADGDYSNNLNNDDDDDDDGSGVGGEMDTGMSNRSGGGGAADASDSSVDDDVPDFDTKREPPAATVSSASGSGKKRKGHVAAVMQDLVSAVHQYQELDGEGYVAGQKTRFRYARVAPLPCGMDVEEILTTDDSILNQRVSLRKLAPFRQDVDKLVNKNWEAERKKWARRERRLQHIQRSSSQAQAKKKKEKSSATTTTTTSTASTVGHDTNADTKKSAEEKNDDNSSTPSSTLSTPQSTPTPENRDEDTAEKKKKKKKKKNRPNKRRRTK